MQAVSPYQFFFGDQTRKSVVVFTALAISQVVALATADAAPLSRYLSISAVAFLVVATIGPTLYDRLFRTRSHDCKRSQTLQVLGSEFECLRESDVRPFLRRKRLAITGAAADVIPQIALDLLRHDPAVIFLFDDDEEQLNRYVRYLRRIRPGIQAEAIVCRLSDRDALQRQMHDHSPDVVLDATAYGYVNTKAALSREAKDMRRVATSLYERAEIVSNLVRVCSAAPAIESMFFALPQTRKDNATKNWLALYDELLRGRITEVGAHVADSKAVLSVWRPVHARATRSN